MNRFMEWIALAHLPVSVAFTLLGYPFWGLFFAAFGLLWFALGSAHRGGS